MDQEADKLLVDLDQDSNPQPQDPTSTTNSTEEAAAAPLYDNDKAKEEENESSGSNPEPPSQTQHQQQAKSTVGATREPKQKKPKRSSKLDRLKRSPSLDRVVEESEKGAEKETSSKGGSRNPFGCSDFVGVRSYLHNFYEQRAYKDPQVYEDDDYRYLSGGHPKRRRCTSIWWKVFVWIGANFLVFGILGVLIGYLVPQKDVIIDSLDANLDVIDRQAIRYNENLDVCKLVGLVLFCIGGLTLTVALLSPTFLYNFFEEDRYGGGGGGEAPFKVRVVNEYTDEPPMSPTDKSIPASASVKNVQPERKADESIITKEGMLPYHD